MSTPRALHAVTVLGHDRPGIIAEVTAHLAELGLNLEDSSMTLLRGHFAMTLVCAGGATSEEVAAALRPVEASGLTVTVQPVPDEHLRPAGADAACLLSVHGADRPGIVSAVVAEVAGVGGNVTDLTTRLSGELYVLLAEIALPSGVDAGALEAAVGQAAQRLGVSATLRPAEPDDL